jgi:hypothetical protein
VLNIDVYTGVITLLIGVEIGKPEEEAQPYKIRITKRPDRRTYSNLRDKLEREMAFISSILCTNEKKK